MPLRLSRPQVRAVDQIAIDRYHVPGIVLMENAARGATEIAWDMLGHTPAPVLILCGGGNNGGDGLAIARHLHNRGCSMTIALTTDPANFKGDALINWRIVEAMRGDRLHIQTLDGPLPDAALVIDAIVGTGLTRPIDGPARWAIELTVGRRILAIDIPSGLDCDTGEPIGDTCVRATRTVTFVAEKLGFANPASRAYTGDVSVVDIGCPQGAVEEALRA
ncbi:MAG TPA: NAD(P)H-hydrate epimerase [Tepidisphaeraceae bacterium]|nr:NAD(P)H-hydrate epimerase [Tepidisphaeraceae bacterium]